MDTLAGSNLLIGSDIVAISRITQLLDNYPNKFKKFAFSPLEQQYCDKQANPSQHYAARWAIKEAYIKSTGKVGSNPDLSTIEIVRDPTPSLSLSGDGLELLREASTRDHPVDQATIAISLSHEKELDMALGVVIVNL